jgi:hypothetical protein
MLAILDTMLPGDAGRRRCRPHLGRLELETLERWRSLWRRWLTAMVPDGFAG